MCFSLNGQFGYAGDTALTPTNKSLDEAERLENNELFKMLKWFSPIKCEKVKLMIFSSNRRWLHQIFRIKITRRMNRNKANPTGTVQVHHGCGEPPPFKDTCRIRTLTKDKCGAPIFFFNLIGSSPRHGIWRLWLAAQ